MKWRDKTVLFLATGLGIGNIPFAPGTFGSLLGLAVALFLTRLPYSVQVILLVVMIGIAIRIAGLAETLIEKRDPGRIVIDEIVGMVTTLLMLPPRLPVVMLGFILFRLLDILKPFPIRAVERKLKGGAAVVVDDIVAGILTNIILRVILAAWG